MKILVKRQNILKSALLGLSILSIGQNSVRKKDIQNGNIDIIVKTRINASADDAWQLLGKQFGNIASWSEIVKTSKAIKTAEIPETNYRPDMDAPIPARQTVVENKGKSKALIEIITDYSDKDRSLKFYGIGLPKFIAFASDEQTVIPIDDKSCEVKFHLEMQVQGIFKIFKGKIKSRFAQNLKNVQNELKSTLETKQIIIDQTAF